jgi:8-oxo-dGTP pyrophosphatase MutT (NUDIX family)/phosphohistidine phosphatase SixA
MSAGVVVFRPGKEVLMVHRPKYNDWSFPKGKLDRGEHATTAAVREVAEETGLHVRLGPPLSSQRYPVGQGMKTVRYWTGRTMGDDDVGGYLVNAEIDDVAWVPLEDALERLTYPRDLATLNEALATRQRTVPLVVLRHGHSRSRKAWRGDDRGRPLLQSGHLQAQHLVPVLAAYDVRRVISSSSLRCLQTVEPYADIAGLDVEETDRLSEEDATEKKVDRIAEAAIDDAVEGKRGVLLCSHRTVLPLVFDAIGLVDPHLEKGQLLVAHLRKGRVVSTERHLVR